MAKYASKLIEQAKAWLGYNENDGSHKKIIDVYNSHKPLARGYKVKYTDEWCATFVSAVSIKLGYTDIIPTECGCQEQINLFKKLGCWIENENRTPNVGDIIYYHWDDSGVGDCTGWANHVGIVEKVSGGVITVIEGNYSKSVKRRSIDVNAKKIRGYAVPKYDKEPVPETTTSVSVKLPVLKKGDKGDSVKAMQILLIGYGYKMLSTDKKKDYGADSSFGGATERALEKYQTDNKLTVTRKCDKQTWSSLLGL